MAQADRINKARLRDRWQEVNKALAELADLRTWPAGQDIAQVEGKLLEERDEIEFEAGQELFRDGLL